MNENLPTRLCSRCGAKVAPDALRGLCPRCLLALNLVTQTEVPGDNPPPEGTHAALSPPAPAELAKLFPQLEIVECLGRGGMGAVYKARQPKLDRWVALKILLPERRGDPQFAERFAREARALARLDHPDIVAVHDFGEAGGYAYLLMEYVDGLSLRQLLQRGKLAPEEALAIVPKICAALQFAHQQGIVHRDIKPENILVDQQGRVKIADFGIAKLIAPGAQDRSLTGGKDVVGTPHYMAPEQVEQPSRVDHRADIFSLGVVFYEMLTGELPLGKFPPPSSRMHGLRVDVRLDEVVLHALEKEPERRYQQVSEVKTAVEAIVAGDEPRASTSSGTETPGQAVKADGLPSPPRRGPTVAAVAVGCVTFLALTVMTFLLPEAYRSGARVQLKAPGATANDPGNSAPALLPGEFERVKSQRVLTNVITGLGLRERWRQRYGAGAPLTTDEVVELLRRQLDLRAIPKLAGFEVGVFSEHGREEAAELANAVAESYCQAKPPGEAELIDRAVPPLVPARPNRPLALTVAALLGVGLGLLTRGLARWRKTPRRHWELRVLVGLLLALAVCWLCPPFVFSWVRPSQHRRSQVPPPMTRLVPGSNRFEGPKTLQPRAAEANDSALAGPAYSPRSTVAEWLRRVKAGSRDAWDLTTRTNSAGWGPSFTGLWEYGHIRPLHQLGNTEQAMVVSTPFKDNAGRPRVFYAMLRRLEGRWLIARHGYDAAESVSSLMQGFSTNPGMAFDVQSEELVGHWLGACLEFSLTADGQGRWIVTGPEGPLPEPKPFRWAVSGSTLWFQNAEGVRKAEVTWVENDTFHFRYTDGEAQGVWRTESKEAQDPPPAR